MQTRDILRSAKLKATPPRVAVLAALMQSRRPLAIEALSELLGKQAPDTATLYRNMKQMVAAGLVKQISFKQRSALYEYSGSRDHHHLVCTKCGKIEDFACDFKALSRRAIKHSKDFSQISDHSMELYGLCKRCAKSGR